MVALPRDLPAAAAPAARTPDAAAPRGGLNWARDGRDWPNRQYSRFVQADGMQWHVQIAGQGPVLLLLHGTGAATHSWRAMLPLLAEHFMVVAPDLPGHGFTSRPPAGQMSLPGMARGVAALLARLKMQPFAVAGHSAGAAIAVEMCLNGLISPSALISLNGALLPFKGHGAGVFAPLARLFARSRLVPMLFSLHAADPQVVERLLDRTGSSIDADGVKHYARLARDSGHAGAALEMMANWNLPVLAAALPKLRTPLLMVVGDNDRSIPPADGVRVQRLVPGAKLVRLAGLGHLAHEERPAETAALMIDFAKAQAA